MPERWTPDSWRSKADSAGPGLSGPAGAGRRREAACDLPAAGVCGRGAQPEEAARARRRRSGFPAARRRLCGKLRRAWTEQHPRLLPHVPADGGGAHLCRRLAGGEGRPHRRPVRQAALLADREARRQGAAELSRRHRQRHRLHRGGAPARSAPPDRSFPAIGGDAQFAACLRAGRLRQSRQRAAMDARLRQG